jgi:hypothetical protein
LVHPLPFRSPAASSANDVTVSLSGWIKAEFFFIFRFGIIIERRE